MATSIDKALSPLEDSGVLALEIILGIERDHPHYQKILTGAVAGYKAWLVEEIAPIRLRESLEEYAALHGLALPSDMSDPTMHPTLKEQAEIYKGLLSELLPTERTGTLFEGLNYIGRELVFKRMYDISSPAYIDYAATITPPDAGQTSHCLTYDRLVAMIRYVDASIGRASGIAALDLSDPEGHLAAFSRIADDILSRQGYAESTDSH